MIISSNKIKELPESFGNLERLEYFDIGSNALITLPDSFYSLPNLKALDLRYNNITNELPKLTSMNLKELQINFRTFDV